MPLFYALKKEHTFLLNTTSQNQNNTCVFFYALKKEHVCSFFKA